MKEITRVYTVSFTRVLNEKMLGPAFPEMLAPAKDAAKKVVADLKEVLGNTEGMGFDFITLDNVQEFINDSDEVESKKALDIVCTIRREIDHLKMCSLDAINIILGVNVIKLLLAHYKEFVPDVLSIDVVRAIHCVFGIPVEIDHKNLDRIEIISGRSIVR